MKTRMVNRKPCILEKSLMEEAGLAQPVFTHILKSSQAPCYEREDGKWYPLSSVLMVMSAAGFPKPDYNRMAAVATEMLGAVSPEREELEEIYNILTRGKDKKKKLIHQDIRPAEPDAVQQKASVQEKDLLLQFEAGEILGLSRTQISELRKKHPEVFPQRKGKRGAWLYTREEVEALRPVVEEFLRKKSAREAREAKRAEKIRAKMQPRGIGVESPFANESPFSDESPFDGMMDVFGCGEF